MASYTDTLKYLYGLEYRGMKFGLRNIRALLESAGNPEKRFPAIHVAGTNGKGSTASFLASIFMEAGYRTALYTSPHLIRFTERIRINGREISERRLVRYVDRLRPAIETVHATFFEATTCVAFLYFADEEADIAVIEAGLGGRLDATNVLVPLVSVITNIAIDHREYLGNTIGSIAAEKGGIIKPGIPVVTASTDPVALRTLRRIASSRKSRFYVAREIVTSDCTFSPNGRPTLSLSAKHLKVKAVTPGLEGDHQITNAALAVAAVEILFRSKKFTRRFRELNSRSVRRGLIHVRRNAQLRGRFQSIGRNPRYLLDVAHNPDGIRTLVEALNKRDFGPLKTILGVMRDKDYRGMLLELREVCPGIIAVAAATDRALRAEALYRQAMRAGFRAKRGGTVPAGIRLAGRKGTILITGSHFVVGEALQYLRKKKT